MLQNPRKTLGFKKNMVYKIPPGGGGKPYPASGLQQQQLLNNNNKKKQTKDNTYTLRGYLMSSKLGETLMSH